MAFPGTNSTDSVYTGASLRVFAHLQEKQQDIGVFGGA